MTTIKNYYIQLFKKNEMYLKNVILYYVVYLKSTI